MKAKIEGTFYLDGLLEGPVFAEGDEAFIREFVREAKRWGVKFHLSIDGGRFSLLGDTEPAELPVGASSVDAVLKDGLNQLLKNYSAEECGRLMSTLRSVEYVEGYEIQTLYGIHPRGEATVEQRRVGAATIKPAEPPDMRERMKQLGVLAAIFGVIFGISAFFIPYREIASRFWANARPFSLEEVEVQSDAGFSRFFEVEGLVHDKKTKSLHIVCKCLDGYPAGVESMNELWQAAADSLGDRLAIEALARGHLRVEVFDRQGLYAGQFDGRMHRSQEKEGYFYLIIPLGKDIERIKITS